MRQRGSVTLFIIVGVILTLIALGVLFGVKRLAMNDQTPPMVVSTQDESKPNTEEAKPENNQSDKQKEDKDSSNSQNSSDNKDNTNRSEDQKDNNSVADTGSQSNNSEGVDGGSESTESSSSTRSESQAGEDLPQSGPKENLAAFALAALTMSSVAYVRSLRHL